MISSFLAKIFRGRGDISIRGTPCYFVFVFIIVIIFIYFFLFVCLHLGTVVILCVLPCPMKVPLQLIQLITSLMKILFIIFFLPGFSFTDTDNSQDLTGREGTFFLFHSTTSTCSQTFRHLYATLHMR